MTLAEADDCTPGQIDYAYARAAAWIDRKTGK